MRHKLVNELGMRSLSYPREVKIKEYDDQEMQERLIDFGNYIVENSTVKDHKSAYIECQTLNQAPNPFFVEEAADLLAWKMLRQLTPEEMPQTVVGPPSRGGPIAWETAKKLGLKTVLMADRVPEMEEDPNGQKPFAKYNEKKGVMEIYHVPSFTTGIGYFTHKIWRLDPLKYNRIGIIDDVCAYAKLIKAYRDALAELGIDVVYGCMAAKNFKDTHPPQTGFSDLVGGGTKAFNVVRFTGMTKDNKVIVDVS